MLFWHFTYFLNFKLFNTFVTIYSVFVFCRFFFHIFYLIGFQHMFHLMFPVFCTFVAFLFLRPITLISFFLFVFDNTNCIDTLAFPVTFHIFLIFEIFLHILSTFHSFNTFNTCDAFTLQNVPPPLDCQHFLTIRHFNFSVFGRSVVYSRVFGLN